MYLKINLDDVQLDLNDITRLLKKSYGLTNCEDWYRKADGKIYNEFREHCEERIDLSKTQEMAYEIIQKIEELSKLEYAIKTKNKA